MNPHWVEPYMPFARQLDKHHWAIAFPLIGGRGRAAIADQWGIQDFY